MHFLRIKASIETPYPYDLDEAKLGTIYKDFKIQLLDMQLDQRLTNGKIDMTGVFNYLVKARLLDTHRLHRERDESMSQR